MRIAKLLLLLTLCSLVSVHLPAQDKKVTLRDTLDNKYDLSSDFIDSVFNYKVSDKNLGMLGLYADLDYRNLMFTPDKGIRVKTTYFFARSYFGSDFDITRIWSLLGFAGTGKPHSDSEYLEDDAWHFAGGAGFRYLVARLFKLRMGVDIAMGPDNQLAYYIVFGHNWYR